MDKLQRQVTILTILLSGTIVFSILLFTKSFASNDAVIRTQSIVIVDEESRERILIGAPIPVSTNSIRDEYDTLGFDRSVGLEGMIFRLDGHGDIELTLKSEGMNQAIRIGKNKNLDLFGVHNQNQKDSL